MGGSSSKNQDVTTPSDIEMHFMNEEPAANEQVQTTNPGDSIAHPPINQPATNAHASTENQQVGKTQAKTKKKYAMQHRRYISQRFQNFGYLGGGYLTTRVARSHTPIGARFRYGWSVFQ